MSQTTVSAAGMAIGVAGQLADSGPVDIVSGFNDASSQMPFGFGVRNGTEERGYVLATGFSNVVSVAGVNVFSHNHVKAGAVDGAGNVTGDLGASGLLENASIQVLRKGRVMVPVEAAVTRGQRAWCRGVATGSFTAGGWRGFDFTDGAQPIGFSYFVDCRNQGVFTTASFTAADGTTLVAVMECDFTNRP